MHRGEATGRGVYWFVSSFPHFADFYVGAMIVAIMVTPAFIVSGCLATLWKSAVRWSPWEYVLFFPPMLLWDWTNRHNWHPSPGRTGGNLLADMGCICFLAVSYAALRRFLLRDRPVVILNLLFALAACGTLFTFTRYLPMVPFPF